MGKTSSLSKSKYNKNAYSTYLIRIRKDSMLNIKIEEFMSSKGTSLNYLITKLLAKHFDVFYF